MRTASCRPTAFLLDTFLKFTHSSASLLKNLLTLLTGYKHSFCWSMDMTAGDLPNALLGLCFRPLGFWLLDVHYPRAELKSKSHLTHNRKGQPHQ
jgi:hypothetical protein